MSFWIVALLGLAVSSDREPSVLRNAISALLHWIMFEAHRTSFSRVIAILCAQCAIGSWPDEWDRQGGTGSSPVG